MQLKKNATALDHPGVLSLPEPFEVYSIAFTRHDRKSRFHFFYLKQIPRYFASITQPDWLLCLSKNCEYPACIIAAMALPRNQDLGDSVFFALQGVTFTP